MVLGSALLPSNALNRLLQIFAIAVITTVLAIPAAQAQTRNKTSAKKSKSSVVVSRNAIKPVVKRRSVVRISAPARPSHGQLAGLHGTQDLLDLKSSVALVIDQETREVLFSKNDSAVLPIASLTKLMTGLLISEAKLPMDEMITITQDDVDTEKGSTSRLRVGTDLSRGDSPRSHERITRPCKPWSADPANACWASATSERRRPADSDLPARQAR